MLCFNIVATYVATGRIWLDTAGLNDTVKFGYVLLFYLFIYPSCLLQFILLVQ